MIVYRSEKGYDLTHEELDDNFRFFDDEGVTFSGVANFCPTGDLYVILVEKSMGENYVLLGDGTADTGVMGASDININIEAIVSGSKISNHSSVLSPKPFNEFSLSETKEEAISDTSASYTTINFDDFVDLVEVEIDISQFPKISSTQASSLSRGYVVGTETLTSGIYMADLLDDDNVPEDEQEVIFTVGNLVPVPTILDDDDPFGDGSQKHYFKFEGNALDEMGNGTISGSVSFISQSVYGTQSLRLHSENELSMALDSSLALGTQMSVVLTAQVGDNQSMASSQLPNNSAVSRCMLYASWNSADPFSLASSGGGYGNTGDYEWLWEKFSFGNNPSGGNTWGDFGVEPYTFLTACMTIRVLDGQVVEESLGWDGDDTSTALFGFHDIIDIFDGSQTTLPTHFDFNKGYNGYNSWDGAEAYFDRMRIFNRQLNGLEFATVTSPPNGDSINVYETDSTNDFTYRHLWTVNAGASAVACTFVRGSTTLSLGTPTVDLVNMKITYQYRLAMRSKNFTFAVAYSSVLIRGNNIRIKGYTANG